MMCAWFCERETEREIVNWREMGAVIEGADKVEVSVMEERKKGE